MSETELRKELDEVRRERIWSAVEDTHKLVQQMHGTLYGNGKVGVVTTVATQGQDISSNKSDIAALKKLGNRLVLAVLAITAGGHGIPPIIESLFGV